jgi:hypothetical protein
LAQAGCMAITIVVTGRRTAVFKTCGFVAIILVCWSALFEYFALTGRGELLWKTLVTYPRFYSGSAVANIVASLNPQKWWRSSLLSLWPAVVLCIVACLTHWRDPSHRRLAILLIAMLVGSWTAIAAPGKWLDHYFQLLMPPLCIGAGIARAGCTRSSGHLLAAGSVAVD